MTRSILYMATAALLIAGCGVQQQNTSESENSFSYDPSNYFDPGDRNRTAAEWEPAIGVQITWPLCVPHTLAVELAKDTQLYTLVENEESQREAEKWFGEWGIDLERVTFLHAPQGVDAWWTRDWGPHGVFRQGELYLGDPKYLYATPVAKLPCTDTLYMWREPVIAQYPDSTRSNVPEYKTATDDAATIPIAEQLGMPLLDLPFVSTGGNFLTDGIGTVFSSCVITIENKLLGNTPDDFFRLNDSLLGISNYHLLSNFEAPYGIQHVDCMMKVIDEETILVAEPPTVDEAYHVYEDIVNNELAQLTTPYGRPYTIKRIKIADSKTGLAAYTNSLILNRTVYVPLFDIDLDSAAINTWKEVLPGYEVKGFKWFLDDEPEEIITEALRRHYGEYGWNSGDALHCRTRAVWDPEMLFLTLKKIESPLPNGTDPIVHVSVIDYSGKGLIEEELLLNWRPAGKDTWQNTLLSPTENPMHFYAVIPTTDDSTIEYFVAAKSKSGRTATRPASAPAGYYTFQIAAGAQ